MADGGEGSLEALSAASEVEWHSVPVLGLRPERGDISARWLRLPTGESVLELASVAGLTTVDVPMRDPEQASTYGFGQLLGHVLEECPDRVVLALGGSATVDGGLGLLQALGAHVFVGGRKLDRPVTGGELASVDSIDLEPARRRVAGVSLVAAADVRNPLLGTNGAVAVYAPQKGASPEAMVRLESGLARLAQELEDAGEQPGDGAAGGAAFGLRVGLGAVVLPGARVFADAVGLDAACAQADGIVTGEGCYDGQTEQGKVAWEVASIASKAGIPCAIVAGRVERTAEELERDPFTWHLSLEEIARTKPELTTDADRFAAAGEHLARAAMA